MTRTEVIDRSWRLQSTRLDHLEMWAKDRKCCVPPFPSSSTHRQKVKQLYGTQHWFISCGHQTEAWNLPSIVFCSVNTFKIKTSLLKGNTGDTRTVVGLRKPMPQLVWWRIKLRSASLASCKPTCIIKFAFEGIAKPIISIFVAKWIAQTTDQTDMFSLTSFVA